MNLKAAAEAASLTVTQCCRAEVCCGRGRQGRGAPAAKRGVQSPSLAHRLSTTAPEQSSDNAPPLQMRGPPLKQWGFSVREPLPSPKRCSPETIREASPAEEQGETEPWGLGLGESAKAARCSSFASGVPDLHRLGVDNFRGSPMMRCSIGKGPGKRPLDGQQGQRHTPVKFVHSCA